MENELHSEIAKLITDSELKKLFQDLFIKQSVWAFQINSVDETVSKHNAEVRFLKSLSALTLALDPKLGHERTLDVIQEVVMPYLISSSSYLLVHEEIV